MLCYPQVNFGIYSSEGSSRVKKERHRERERGRKTERGNEGQIEQGEEEQNKMGKRRRD
jgi:hypothetical protein